MENKKKQLIYLTVIVLSGGLMAWIWWGGGLVGGGSGENTLSAAGLSATSLSGSVPTGGKAVLPYGKTLKTEVFSDPRFKGLVVPPQLEISSAELGRENPFLPL